MPEMFGRTSSLRLTVSGPCLTVLLSISSAAFSQSPVQDIKSKAQRLVAPLVENRDGPLQAVASFDHQVTGVTVAPDGRIFVNFPRWTEDTPVSVAELMPDGSTKPYPNEEWNKWRNAGMSSVSSRWSSGMLLLATLNRVFLQDKALDGASGGDRQVWGVRFDAARRRLKDASISVTEDLARSREAYIEQRREWEGLVRSVGDAMAYDAKDIDTAIHKAWPASALVEMSAFPVPRRLALTSPRKRER